MDKPYLLRPWEIERLTDKQIIELYYRKRDNKGVPVSYEQQEHEWKHRTAKDQKVIKRKELEALIRMGSALGANVNGLRKQFIDKYGDPYQED